jgi:hypothetical protein
MQFTNFGNTEIFGMDWAMTDRQTALQAMHHPKLRPATVASSGWGTDVTGEDKRSVRASLNRKCDMRTAWWKLYSRAYVAVVFGADLEQTMYAFHRMHHTFTLGWLSYVLSVRHTTADIKRRGLLAAAINAASGKNSYTG